MSMLKWTMESVWAAAAVIVTTGGGIATTAIHWGAVNSQVSAIEAHQVDTDTKVEKMAVDNTEQKIHNARVEQSLADVISRLDRMERAQNRVLGENDNHR